MHGEILESSKTAWIHSFRDSKFRHWFFSLLVFFVFAVFCVTRFLVFNEEREGVLLKDPILDLFVAVDLTWPIFVVLYSAVLVAIFALIDQPRDLLIGFQAYAILVLFRVVLMYTIPLEPPEGMIALKDPFVGLFWESKTLTKDLFFSGHTSTMMLLLLVSKNPWVKRVFLIAAILVGSGVVLQKVHYTVDVLVAPFVAYGSVVISRRIANLFLGASRS